MGIPSGLWGSFRMTFQRWYSSLAITKGTQSPNKMKPTVGLT